MVSSSIMFTYDTFPISEDRVLKKHQGQIGRIGCQFLPLGGIVGLWYASRLLFSEKSQITQ